MVKLLDIPETITYSLSNVKLILVTNNYFVEINQVIKGLRVFVKNFDRNRRYNTVKWYTNPLSEPYQFSCGNLSGTDTTFKRV